MDYKVLIATGFTHYEAAELLENMVLHYVRAGWEPAGGITIDREKYGNTITYTFTQAVYKPLNLPEF